MSDEPPTRLDLECGNEEPSEAIPSRSIQFNLHSCYYNDFFLLRTLIAINGTPAEIKIDPSGTSLIQHSESGLDYPLPNLVPGVATTLNKKHGVYHIDTFYHEEAALFSVVFPSQSGLRNFLENKEKVESDLVEVLSTQFMTGSVGNQQIPAQANGSLSGQDQAGKESRLKVCINVELFLASPIRSTQQKEQSPKVNKVTLATFQHFMEKWQHSKLFEFDSKMFNSSQCPSVEGEDAKLKDLQRELKGVDTWFQLGLELDIPDDELRIIRKDNILFGVEQCLLEVLIKWGDCEKPTWTKVVGALVKIGRHVLAENIAKKYGMEMPRIPTTNAGDKIADSEDVERKLSCKQHDLDTAVQSRDKLIENIETDLSAELIELQGENNSLQNEIELLEAELKLKNEESEYLKQSQKKMKSSWQETVERMKHNSHDKIKQLQQLLARKTQKLTQIQEQLERKEKELEEKTAEVEETSALVNKLRDEVEKLKQSFSEQQQEMNLRQIESTAYSIASKRHLEEMKLQQEYAKHEAEVKRKEIETHTQNLTSKDEQISQLIVIIKENETKMDKLQEEAVLSENEQKLLKLSLHVKLIRLKKQLKDAEHEKWLSQYKQTIAQADLQKYKSSIPDISKCTVSLAQEKLEKHTLSHLQVCLFDEDGDPCSGSHNIDTKLTLLADDSIVAGTFSKPVKDNSGEYVVSFTPTRAGDYEIQVTINGTPLPSRPLNVMVYNYPDPGNCHATGSGPRVVEKDKDSECQVVLLDSDSDPCWMEDDIEAQLMTSGNREDTHRINLTAKLVHCKSKSTLQCDVHNEQKNIYKITYQPTKRGKHQLNVQINGRQIQSSPFTIEVTSSPEGIGLPVRVVGNLKGPHFVTNNSQNQIIVTESYSDCVSVFSPEGKKIHSVTFESDGTSVGHVQFKVPTGITVDTVGNIYVVDNNNHCIHKFTFDWKVLQTVGALGSGQLQFYHPMGVAFNPNNRKLYVCDQGNHRIQVLNPGLTYHSTIGRKGTGNGEFKKTMVIAFNNNGDIYVTDHYNHRVQIFDEDGTFLRTLSKKEHGETLQYPCGIAVDSSDIVYVSEQDRCCISVFTADGEYLTTFGGEGIAAGQFVEPRGLHIDKNDFLLVCDTDNGRLQIFRLKHY